MRKHPRLPGGNVRWLYLLSTDTLVKVGQTGNPNKRQRDHGDCIRRFHLFPPYPSVEVYAAEAAAIAALSKVGKRIGMTEQFTGLTFDQALAVVRKSREPAPEVVADADPMWHGMLVDLRAAGWTQEAIATAIGVTQARISQILRSKGASTPGFAQGTALVELHRRHCERMH